MSIKLFDLKQQHKYALDKADNIVKTAEAAGRELTATEDADFRMSMKAANALQTEIKVIEKKNTLLPQFGAHGPFDAPTFLPATRVVGRGVQPSG